MYRTLFDLAGYAIFAWLLLILLPKWRITRRIAESAVFPAYLSVLYVVGLVAVLREYGAGFMADFGTADGVLGLLAQEPIAILAWLHILAFDQVVALVIYRDNMRHRFVPLPLQSLLMVATLMLGPLGFITYWLVRLIRTRSPVAWGERHADTDVVASPAPRFAEVVASRGTGDGGGSVHGGTASGVSSRGALARPVAAVLVMISLWRRERAIVALGAAGFGFAVITTVVALLNGGWLLNAEGRLLEAVKFDVAIGIYLLTLALILPFAPMTAGDRRRWTGWTLGLGMFAYLMENVQAWRGLDPRFSSIAGPVDQILGGVFFLAALGLLVLFVDLLARFWSDDALPDHPALRLALRYGMIAALYAFGVGVIMSLVGGRTLGAGNMMPLHAAGFHGVQAVTLIALVAGATSIGDARVATHIAGGGWLLLCTGLLVQALAGVAPTTPAPGLYLAAIGMVVWLGGAVLALMPRAAAVGVVRQE